MWRRKWQPTPVFLPGKPHGQRSLTGYRPWGSKRHNWATKPPLNESVFASRLDLGRHERRTWVQDINTIPGSRILGQNETRQWGKTMWGYVNYHDRQLIVCKPMRLSEASTQWTKWVTFIHHIPSSIAQDRTTDINSLPLLGCVYRCAHLGESTGACGHPP